MYSALQPNLRSHMSCWFTCFYIADVPLDEKNAYKQKEEGAPSAYKQATRNGLRANKKSTNPKQWSVKNLGQNTTTVTTEEKKTRSTILEAEINSPKNRLT